MSNIKDLLTTIFGIVLVIATAVSTYLDGICSTCTIDVWQLIIAIVVAVIAYFTGKTGNGKTKIKPMHN